SSSPPPPPPQPQPQPQPPSPSSSFSRRQASAAVSMSSSTFSSSFPGGARDFKVAKSCRRNTSSSHGRTSSGTLRRRTSAASGAEAGRPKSEKRRRYEGRLSYRPPVSIPTPTRRRPLPSPDFI